MSCRFCEIAQHKVSDYVIWEDGKFMALLDINPANPGHCMLIPKEHVDYFFDLPDSLYLELFKTAKRISEPLRKAMNAKRVGIAVSGFDVHHAHLHLVPLHGSNELFDPSKFHRSNQKELEETQRLLTEKLKNIS